MIIEKKLKNGIPVFFDKMDGIQSVTIGIFVGTGSKYEREDEYGVSHLLEHMMFKGTKRRTAKELSEQIDDVGGNINAYTGKEITAYYIQLLSSRLEVGIDILSDMFLNSTFSDENLEKEKKVVIEEINMYGDIPEEKVHDINSTFAISGDQSNIVLGSIESVNGISREILVNYFNRRYTPENMVISLAGNMDIDKVMEMLENTMGIIEKKETQTSKEFSMKINSGKKVLKKEMSQVHLCINTKGISYLDEDRYKYSIISNILAGNMSSRLFQKIREDRGLVYSIYSYMSNFREGGLFTIYAGTTPKDYNEVIKIVLEEFEEIKKNSVTEKELERSKNQFLSSLTFGLENSRARMSRLANSYLTYGRIKTIEETIEEIEKISCEDIKKVANKVFSEEYYSYTILGDV
ncbi:MAG: peptidase M16 [Fusobacteriia bacterium 4572_74]|nr:MAG: peptidase M16 [Fusobacteriia bacterium 4572_74]